MIEDFDPMRHRPYLERVLGRGGKSLMFVMLNPSRANATLNDPTVTRCMGFAASLGYDRLVVVNLWDYRATNPADLKRAGYPRSSRCDAVIRGQAREHGTAICAWGANARSQPQRVAEVVAMLREADCKPMVLQTLADGWPQHPLFVPRTALPKTFFVGDGVSEARHFGMSHE